MTKIVKIAALAAVVLAATPAVAAPVGVVGAKPQASARIIKPLTLTAADSLDFGTIVMDSIAVGGTADATVATDGTISCDAGLICDPTGSVITYTVTGTQGQVVNIDVSTNASLTGSNGGSLSASLSDSAGGSLTLGNSGAPGNSFTVGGSITIADTTADGVYSGDVDVTVDYN